MSFPETPIDQIAAIHKRTTDFQATNKSYPLEYRKQQLRKFYWALKDHEDEALEACKKDLGKPGNEAFITEIGWVYKDIFFALENLDKWAAAESVAEVETLFKILLKPRVRKEPIGTVLIIG